VRIPSIGAPASPNRWCYWQGHPRDIGRIAQFCFPPLLANALTACGLNAATGYVPAALTVTVTVLAPFEAITSSVALAEETSPPVTLTV
jgi:hypothetical protein